MYGDLRVKFPKFSSRWLFSEGLARNPYTLSSMHLPYTVSLVFSCLHASLGYLAPPLFAPKYICIDATGCIRTQQDHSEQCRQTSQFNDVNHSRNDGEL